MSKIAGFFAAAMLLQAPACDLNELAGKGPEQIKMQAEEQLQEYFPKAKVWISGKDGAIFGLTCTSNLGKPVIEQMVPVLERTPGVQELKNFRKYEKWREIASILGVQFTTYKYFALGFDSSQGIHDVLRT